MPDEQTLGELSRSIQRVEDKHEKLGEIQDIIASSVRDDANKIRDLRRELDEVRRVADVAKLKADGVASVLAEKERAEKARADDLTRLGRWAQIALTVIITVLLGWSGQFTAALGKFQSILGGGK